MFFYLSKFPFFLFRFCTMRMRNIFVKNSVFFLQNVHMFLVLYFFLSIKINETNKQNNYIQSTKNKMGNNSNITENGKK